MEKKEFIKQWMKTYEPDTFKAGEIGRYFYRSEDLSSGIDLECFFEDLLTDFESALAKETEQQGNCNLPHVSNNEVAVEPEKHKCINCEKEYEDIDEAIMCCYVSETDC